MAAQPKITPFLWFDANAEEAVNHYLGVFKSSRIKQVLRYGDAGPGPKGSVMIIDFELDGQHLTALNGGPHYQFTEAISLVVHCDDQQEVDRVWSKLGEGGTDKICFWLKDKFGLSWQIVPTVFLAMLADKNPAKSQRVFAEMMKQTRPDIARLEAAYKAD